MATSIDQLTEALTAAILDLDEGARIEALNRVRRALHAVSPFRDQPVDLIEWVPSEEVSGNDYNPNVVAPPEMRLLELSISADGYTQPIVAFPEDGRRVIVDGFHRHRVGKESLDVRSRVHGHLPVVTIRPVQAGEAERMAATVRHNRARGKHRVDSMTGLVDALAKKGWDSRKIASELGMDADEVLRFRQISNLTKAFADREFSQAWEPAN